MDIHYAPHPNLGYLVYVDHAYLGSVRQLDNLWRAKHFSEEVTAPTRRAAVEALLNRLDY